MSGFDALGYYKVLEAEPQENDEQLRRRYRDLAKIWHPDHNTSEEALENFQKLSVAYEILKDEKRRLIYDMLSLVYTEKNYPDIENIKPYEDIPGDADVRMLSLHKVRGWFWKHTAQDASRVCSRGRAVYAEAANAAANWLFGWWHPRAFVNNLRALRTDYKFPLPAEENLRILVHNAVAGFLSGDQARAVASAALALPYADSRAKETLQAFISRQGLRVRRFQPWHPAALKAVQLIVPFCLLIAVTLSFSSRYVSDAELWNWFGSQKEIDYYQEVDFAGRGRSVDDVVVGKILNIPVDRSDISRLYHVRENEKLMYGPSDDFDVMKKIPARTTVRLTGLSPDNIWARVMIDNGEMGFIRLEKLQKGIGKKIPDFSEIYSAD